MRQPLVLIAMGDEDLRKDLKGPLLRLGLHILESDDKACTFKLFQKGGLDLILIGASGSRPWDSLEVARQIRAWDQRIPLMLIMASSSEELAIAALKSGVNDYFKQPVPLEELSAAIRRCLAASATPASIEEDERIPSRLLGGQRMVGESPQIEAIRTYIYKVASADANVLITGETGTGKELVAELIHKNSSRLPKGFTCINCAAIPDTLLESELFGYERGAFTGADTAKEGKLRLASGGTVFFDEIGDMSPYAQAKILRAIESKQVERLGGKVSLSLDIRVIAATNHDLELLVTQNRFREDLYFRLNVARIHLPPLRERKTDIPSLLNYYLKEFNGRFGRSVEGFTEETIECLLGYAWPGNVRELKNVLEASFINQPGSRITFMDLPKPFRSRLRGAEVIAPSELNRLLCALASTNWNKSKAASKLHWSRMTLYRKMAKYHLPTKDEMEKVPPS